MNIFTAETALPPSLDSLPLLAMLSQVGYWIVLLLCLQWIYSLLDDAYNHPAPPGSYVRVARGVKIRLLLVVLTFIVPRLISLVAWRVLDPYWRETWSMLSWVVAIPCSIWAAVAWWRDRGARPVERQNIRFRFVEVSPPTVHEKTRGVVALVLIFAVAFATTFVRLDPQDAPRSTATVERS